MFSFCFPYLYRATFQCRILVPIFQTDYKVMRRQKEKRLTYFQIRVFVVEKEVLQLQREMAAVLFSRKFRRICKERRRRQLYLFLFR